MNRNFLVKRWRDYIVYVVPILLGLISVSSVVGIPDPALEPDDIRYFRQVRELLSDPFTYWRHALVITNSWEDQWWVEPGKVRYLRPIPILTYLFDLLLFGESSRGLLITNAVFYLILCCTVTSLLLSLISNRVAVAVGAMWFATLPIHDEGIAYIAGRTDVLAWIFGVLMIRAHVVKRPIAEKVLFLLMALLCKEYCVLLPFICFFFYQETGDSFRRIRNREMLTYVLLAATYVVARFFILGGRSIEGTQLPIYFPVSTLLGGLNQLLLQTLSFVAVSIAGVCVPVYATVASRDVVNAAVVSLPFFFAVLLCGKWSPTRRACTLFLIISLAATAPLYISSRYFFGPSIAFVCCISLCYGGLVRTWQRIALLVCVLPVVVLHADVLSSAMRNQIDPKATIVTPVSEVLRALDQRKEELRQCSIFLVTNAPRSQVFQMFLTDFFKISLGRFNVKTVILSHQHSQHSATAQEEEILEVQPTYVTLKNSQVLVSEESSGLNHIQPGIPRTGMVADTFQIDVDADWKVLHAKWRPIPGSQVCVVNFKYQPTTVINVKGTSVSLPDEVSLEVPL